MEYPKKTHCILEIVWLNYRYEVRETEEPAFGDLEV